MALASPCDLAIRGHQSKPLCQCRRKVAMRSRCAANCPSKRAASPREALEKITERRPSSSASSVRGRLGAPFLDSDTPQASKFGELPRSHSQDRATTIALRQRQPRIAARKLLKLDGQAFKRGFES